MDFLNTEKNMIINAFKRSLGCSIEDSLVVVQHTTATNHDAELRIVAVVMMRQDLFKRYQESRNDKTLFSGLNNSVVSGTIYRIREQVGNERFGRKIVTLNNKCAK
jgi:hypothetical protein